MKLTHVRLLVPNYEECFGFYQDVMGLQAGFGDATSGYADLSGGSGECSVLALFDREEQGGAVGLREERDDAMLVFEVDDVDGAAERFSDWVTGPPQSRPEWGIRFVHLRDPAGNLIELNQQIPMEES